MRRYTSDLRPAGSSFRQPVSADFAWVETCDAVLGSPFRGEPRGYPCLELYNHVTVTDMLKPLVVAPWRKLNYRFAAAEAFWILTGDNTVEGIAPYNKRIADFSDDGVTMAGAYGPPIKAQLEYVVKTLLADRDTRQAILTIWRPAPAKSKDIPCTIAVSFFLRPSEIDRKVDLLHASVFMRSSDVWLGLPYDIFTFSMLGCYISAILNEHRGERLVAPGTLFNTAVNRHLYLSGMYQEDVPQIIEDHIGLTPAFIQPSVPLTLYTDGPECTLEYLDALRQSKIGDAIRWWTA